MRRTYFIMLYKFYFFIVSNDIVDIYLILFRQRLLITSIQQFLLFIINTVFISSFNFVFQCISENFITLRHRFYLHNLAFVSNTLQHINCFFPAWNLLQYTLKSVYMKFSQSALGELVTEYGRAQRHFLIWEMSPRLDLKRRHSQRIVCQEGLGDDSSGFFGGWGPFASFICLLMFPKGFIFFVLHLFFHSAASVSQLTQSISVLHKMFFSWFFNG